VAQLTLNRTQDTHFLKFFYRPVFWRTLRTQSLLSEVSSLWGTQQGRAIAQAVSRRLPTSAARVQTRVW
jgi:hypothetical protein